LRASHGPLRCLPVSPVRPFHPRRSALRQMQQHSRARAAPRLAREPVQRQRVSGGSSAARSTTRPEVGTGRAATDCLEREPEEIRDPRDARPAGPAFGGTALRAAGLADLLADPGRLLAQRPDASVDELPFRTRGGPRSSRSQLAAREFIRRRSGHRYTARGERRALGLVIGQGNPLPPPPCCRERAVSGPAVRAVHRDRVRWPFVRVRRQLTVNVFRVCPSAASSSDSVRPARRIRFDGSARCLAECTAIVLMTPVCTSGQAECAFA